MEEYMTTNNNHLSQNTSSRTSLFNSLAAGGSNSSVGNRHHRFPINTPTFHRHHLQSGGAGSDHYFQCQQVQHESDNSSHLHSPIFHHLLTRGNGNLHHHAVLHNPYPSQQGDQSQRSNSQVEAMKAKITAHPHYPNLLQLYMDCQKVGAPPEVVARLDAAERDFEARWQRSSVSSSSETCKDPELDQFMEAYCDMLVKYREELTRPIQEAMDFMRRIETQLNMRIFSDDKCEGVGSSEEEQDNSGGETELPVIDPRAEDRELKNHLLKKYSGCLSSLKQELSKKKKKGKLAKDARQKLLSWWELHYKWPYPSESEKVVLAESTGLEQKQINNWFINQRKRHWKPSEDMQFMMMDDLHLHNATLCMDGWPLHG